MASAEPSSPSPFFHQPVPEVPLSRAPLVRVLAQVRFDNLAVFKRDNFINPLLDRLSAEYPLLEEAHETELIVGPSGISTQESTSPIWRIKSIDKLWTITVSPGSLAIETAVYSSRADFLSRCSTACSAFIECIGQSAIQRIGIRYTNQVLDESIEEGRLIEFFHPLLRGALTIPTTEQSALGHTVMDAVFNVRNRNLQGRWGLLPARAVFDPSIPPAEYRTWFLDIDSFTSEAIEMSSDAITEEIKELAVQEYNLFRYIVTDRFIDTFR